MMNTVTNFLHDEDGAVAIEYAFVVAGVIGFIGGVLQFLFSNIASEIEHVAEAVTDLVGQKTTPAGLLGGVSATDTGYFSGTI